MNDPWLVALAISGGFAVLVTIWGIVELVKLVVLSFRCRKLPPKATVLKGSLRR